jgi:hypothetical protein
VSVVAICTAGGSAAATTTTTLLAAMSPASVPTLVAECDPSGGDLAAWAQLSTSPGWSSAVSMADRSFQGLMAHAQSLPSGLRAVLAPARAGEARTVVNAAATTGFGDLLASMPEVMAFADCGRVSFESPAWVPKAQLTLLLLRQSAVSAYATAALVERTAEAFDLVSPASRQLGVVLIGTSPYSPAEVSTALGTALFGVLPEDRVGAGYVAGGWTVRRADRSPLAKAARGLAERVVSAVYATSNGHVGTTSQIGAGRG